VVHTPIAPANEKEIAIPFKIVFGQAIGRKQFLLPGIGRGTIEYVHGVASRIEVLDALEVVDQRLKLIIVLYNQVKTMHARS
jgi:hypothetical protein